MSRLAVVLFNLGGPDRPEAVEPFLFNLFNDPAIIALPWPLRPLLARLISRRRAPTARAIYDRLGGGSPILPLTRQQAAALAARLASEAPGDDIQTFVTMRYWHPMSDATAQAVKEFRPDAIVLLPLYPQYSTTTTASSLRDWELAARNAGLADVPTRAVCCYPTQAALIQAQVALIAPALDEAAKSGLPRLLFSAHGLPKKVIARGDPYAWQVEQTAGSIAVALAMPGLDWAVCYQSRVGPLEWIGPSTESELRRAAADRVPVVVVPVAFVSEHSETLVELDIEYRELAEKLGIPAYIRVPALGIAEGFIAALAALVAQCRQATTSPQADGGKRLCPAAHVRCAMSGH